MQISGGSISGNKAVRDGGGIYCNTLYFMTNRVPITGSVRITGNSAGADGGGVYIARDKLGDLDVGPDVVFSGNSARYACDRSPADDALYEAHVSATHWTSPLLQGYNNYDISDTAGARVGIAVICAQMSALGARLPAGAFNFELVEADSGTPVATATNAADGSVTFSVRADEPASSFLIREVPPAPEGWTLDMRDYPVDAALVNGEVEVTYPQGAPIFTNAYSLEPAAVILSAVKRAAGAPLPAGRFDFGVFDSNGNLISTASCDGAGDVSFPGILAGEPGTAVYTVRELSPDGGGWISDTNSFPVEVSASDDGHGSLSLDVSYPSGVPVFTDTYTSLPASEPVRVYKELKGWGSQEIPFTFGLYDSSGSLLETAVNSGGQAVFAGVSYSEPGVHAYTVRELTPSGDGWTADPSVIPVSVTVTCDGQGRLIASTAYPDGVPVFTNEYSPAPARVSLSAVKSASGAKLPEGRFTFAVLDENGSPVSSASNDARSAAHPPARTSTRWLRRLLTQAAGNVTGDPGR